MSGNEIVLIDARDYELSAMGQAARFVTAFTSLLLLLFYTYQWHKNRATTYAIYIQFVTALTYGVGAAGVGDWLIAPVVFGNEVRDVALGRYLIWMITCPVALFSFFGIISMMGPNVEPVKVHFMVMKDLITMALGIMSTFQESDGIRYLFVSLSITVALWFLYELYYIEKVRHEYFEGDLIMWLRGITALFLMSWGVFPLLFFLGPPVLNIVSFEGDIIGHAIGDLLAKNFFGFCMWWMRYKVMIPYIEAQGNNVCHYTGYGLSEDGTMVTYMRKLIVPTPEDHEDDDMEHAKPTARVGGMPPRRIANGHAGAAPTRVVLVVEPNVNFQRLLMYLLADANVHPVMVMDVTQAKQTVRRGRVDEFDAILVNLTEHFEDQDTEMPEFKRVLADRPFMTPVLGYSFEDASLKYMEREEKNLHMCHGVVHHMLDEVFLSDLIGHWATTARAWRDAARAKELESSLEHSRDSLHLGVRPVSRNGGAAGRSYEATTPVRNDADLDLAMSSFKSNGARQAMSGNGELHRAAVVPSQPQQMYVPPNTQLSPQQEQQLAALQQLQQLHAQQAQQLQRSMSRSSMTSGSSFVQTGGQGMVRVPSGNNMGMTSPTSGGGLQRVNSFSQQNNLGGGLQRVNSFSQQNNLGGGLQRSNSFQQRNGGGLSRSSSFTSAPGSPVMMGGGGMEVDDDTPCDNVGCNRVSELICGGCQKALYCSRECQLAHWRAGHKRRCKDIAAGIPGPV